MKNWIVRLTTLMLFIIFGVSCEFGSKQKTSREDLDLLMRTQMQALLQNGMSSLMAGGNSGAIRERGPMGFWFYPPWMYYGAGVASSDGSMPVYMDSSYYDASTGYWVYRYRDSTFFWQWRYKFLPHDNDGYPTAQTDQYLFDQSFSGQYRDYFNILYEFNGESDYQITGLKDWIDTMKTGKIVFNGSSRSDYNQIFSVDTNVTFSYTEAIDHVTWHENDCSPRSGSMNFNIVQNATPDSFIYVYQFEENTSELLFQDFRYSGITIFTSDGVRCILDGEEYYYEVDCGNVVTIMGKTPKLSRRR